MSDAGPRPDGEWQADRPPPPPPAAVAMKTCKECLSPMNAKARRCSSCGGRQEALGVTVLKVVLILMAVWFVLGALAAIGR